MPSWPHGWKSAKERLKYIKKLQYECCEQQRERAAQPSEEPQRGVNSLDGKVKRNHLNTPNRYEYSDVYIQGD